MLAACTNDGGTCGPTADCVIPGADLEVTAVTVGSPGRTHPVTGLRVVDSLRVTYTVRNAGTASSEKTLALVAALQTSEALDTIAPLAPGASVTRSTLLPLERLYFDGAWATDKFAAMVGLQPLDINTANNQRTSDTAHLALPILKVTMQHVAEPRVRVNDPLRMTATVTNLSAVATARDIQLRHCMWDFDVGCWAANWTAFGNTPLPDVGPGETKTISYTTAIPQTGVENGYFYHSMAVCITSRADTQPYRSFDSLHDGTWICGSAGLIEVLPDYEACNPPLLGAQPATLTVPNCGIYPMPTDPGNWTAILAQKRFYVFALDAVGGQTYQVTGLPERSEFQANGRRAEDLEPAAGLVRFERTGRYYFIVYAPAGVFTATATVVP